MHGACSNARKSMLIPLNDCYCPIPSQISQRLRRRYKKPWDISAQMYVWGPYSCRCKGLRYFKKLYSLERPWITWINKHLFGGSVVFLALLTMIWLLSQLLLKLILKAKRVAEQWNSDSFSIPSKTLVFFFFFGFFRHSVLATVSDLDMKQLKLLENKSFQK